MSLDCPAIIPRDKCGAVHPSRVLPDRSVAPIAIVLHQINQGVEAYDSSLTTPVPRFPCATPPICTELAPTVNPKSVHLLVTETGVIQYAELSRVTLGIDYLYAPSWSGANAISVENINELLIHVGVIGNPVTDVLVNALCCIQRALTAPVPIIAASDLQADRAEYVIPPSIPEAVELCRANGGPPLPPTIGDLEDRVTALEACCIANSSGLALLTTRVNGLTTRVLTLEDTVARVLTDLETIRDTVSVIPALVATVTTLVNQVADILARCCPTPPVETCFRYQLLPGDEMVITPQQPVWLNLPTKIEDTTPPVVLAGPLWSATLNTCTWSLEANVRFRLTDWCSGKKASLYLWACGKKYLLAEYTVPSSGLRTVTLQGTFLLSPGCTDVHLLVATNDNSTSAKIVEFAEFRGCCA